jgi:hypothetical protein
VELERIILRALSKERTDRYDSVSAFARDLAPFAPRDVWADVGRQLEPYTTGTLQAEPIPPPPSKEPPLDEEATTNVLPSTPRPPRAVPRPLTRSGWVVGVALTLALAILAVVLVTR